MSIVLDSGLPICCVKYARCLGSVESLASVFCWYVSFEVCVTAWLPGAICFASRKNVQFLDIAFLLEARSAILYGSIIRLVRVVGICGTVGMLCIYHGTSDNVYYLASLFGLFWLPVIWLAFLTTSCITSTHSAASYSPCKQMRKEKWPWLIKIIPKISKHWKYYKTFVFWITVLKSCYICAKKFKQIPASLFGRVGRLLGCQS